MNQPAIRRLTLWWFPTADLRWPSVVPLLPREVPGEREGANLFDPVTSSGFITGEQITPGGPWHLRITDELRRRLVPDVPEGWLPLHLAAKALGVARQTVVHKVQRGELEAVHVTTGKRKGLRIKVFDHTPGLFATTE